jgi:hypothetical protein
MKSFNVILKESPEIIHGGQNPLWKMYTNMADSIHKTHGIHVADHITLVHDSSGYKNPDFNRQYLMHGSIGSPKLRVEFKNHKFDQLKGLRGTYASLVHKGDTSDNISDGLKTIYDSELSSHDYLTSDSTQMEGGRYIWKNLTKDYENSGKHLYVHDGQKFTKVSHKDIINSEHLIWGQGSNFSNVRLVVSNASF